MSCVVCQVPQWNLIRLYTATFVNQTYNLIKEKPKEVNLTRTTFSETMLNNIALYLARNSLLIECWLCPAFYIFFPKIRIRITDISFPGPFSLNATIALASQQFLGISFLYQDLVKKINSSGPETFLTNFLKLFR